ncbi:Mgm101p Ecym_5144 [Eremothecium cymbalariae DBVPG|uniref:Mitochondrial genome maintenance protein MGM101 n=1 Tax=Eremothecium cymbalariae (strain CBS 270.75 / DBVPG 7215 / KCTC 17166 / NRRL Y-17582) TaxID=931890 RepID=I6NCX9_ERECY|nr:hypothetical protein Ecym_5144 [Eremothecium cymbalariae DBVPG\
MISRSSIGKFANLARSHYVISQVKFIGTAGAVKPVAGSSSPMGDPQSKLSNPAHDYKRTLSNALNGDSLEIGGVEKNIRPDRGGSVDWYSSFHGLGSKPFDESVQNVLSQPLVALDIEITPDGLLYLPEIKYRRILNKAFGAGGWGLAPRSETTVTARLVTREYALICNGQLVSLARGEQDYFSETGIPTATEGCKSNALMRCCKDLGIGSELWDPVFIKSYKKQYCVEKFVEHIATKRKKKIWLRKDRDVEYPYK